MRSAPHHTRARYVGFSSLGPPRGRRWTRSVSASYTKEGSGGIPTAFENSRRRPNHYHRTGDGSLPVSKLARANTEPSRFAGGTSDRVIVLMHHEETGNNRIVRLVVRCHQLDKYGSAARSDSRSGRGPVDWRRHVFRGGACRHRHHAAQTSVGSRSRPIRRVDGLRESDLSHTRGFTSFAWQRVDSRPLRRVKHLVGAVLSERAVTRPALPLG